MDYNSVYYQINDNTEYGLFPLNLELIEYFISSNKIKEYIHKGITPTRNTIKRAKMNNIKHKKTLRARTTVKANTAKSWRQQSANTTFIIEDLPIVKARYEKLTTKTSSTNKDFVYVEFKDYNIAVQIQANNISFMPNNPLNSFITIPLKYTDEQGNKQDKNIMINSIEVQLYYMLCKLFNNDTGISKQGSMAFEKLYSNGINNDFIYTEDISFNDEEIKIIALPELFSTYTYLSSLLFTETNNTDVYSNVNELYKQDLVNHNYIVKNKEYFKTLLKNQYSTETTDNKSNLEYKILTELVSASDKIISNINENKIAVNNLQNPLLNYQIFIIKKTGNEWFPLAYTIKDYDVQYLPIITENITTMINSIYGKIYNKPDLKYQNYYTQIYMDNIFYIDVIYIHPFDNIDNFNYKKYLSLSIEEFTILFDTTSSNPVKTDLSTNTFNFYLKKDYLLNDKQIDFYKIIDSFELVDNSIISDDNNSIGDNFDLLSDIIPVLLYKKKWGLYHLIYKKSIEGNNAYEYYVLEFIAKLGLTNRKTISTQKQSDKKIPYIYFEVKHNKLLRVSPILKYLQDNTPLYKFKRELAITFYNTLTDYYYPFILNHFIKLYKEHYNSDTNTLGDNAINNNAIGTKLMSIPIGNIKINKFIKTEKFTLFIEKYNAFKSGKKDINRFLCWIIRNNVLDNDKEYDYSKLIPKEGLENATNNIFDLTYEELKELYEAIIIEYPSDKFYLYFHIYNNITTLHLHLHIMPITGFYRNPRYGLYMFLHDYMFTFNIKYLLNNLEADQNYLKKLYKNYSMIFIDNADLTYIET
jgi:hypothetical protein